MGLKGPKPPPPPFALVNPPSESGTTASGSRHTIAVHFTRCASQMRVNGARDRGLPGLTPERCGRVLCSEREGAETSWTWGQRRCGGGGTR